MRRQTKGRKERILSHSAGLPALLHCHLNGERIPGSEASNLLLLRSPDPTLHSRPWRPGKMPYSLSQKVSAGQGSGWPNTKYFLNWKIKNTEKKISSNPECQEQPSSRTYPEVQAAVGLRALGRSEARKQVQCSAPSSESTQDSQPPAILSTWVLSRSPDHNPASVPCMRFLEQKEFFGPSYYSASQRKPWAQIGFTYLTLVKTEK